MADLIIKPSAGGQLIIKDEGDDAAITVATNGNTTLAGTANSLGTVTAVTMSSSLVTKESGDVVQHKSKAFASGSQTTSNSTTNTMAGAPYTLTTDVINTGSTASTIWKVSSYVSTNNDATANSTTSCRHYYSVDGGSNWTIFVTSGSHSGHGNYIKYDQGDNAYWECFRVDFMSIATSQSNVKFGAAYYSNEGDSIRWNHDTGSNPPYIEAIQIKI